VLSRAVRVSKGRQLKRTSPGTIDQQDPETVEANTEVTERLAQIQALIAK
jgi:hypothetical protein